MAGGEVFFEEEFQAISDRLDEAEKVEVFLASEQSEWDSDAVRADAVLNDGGEASLKINGEGDEWEHHEEGEKDDLEGDDRKVDEDVRHFGVERWEGMWWDAGGD